MGGDTLHDFANPVHEDGIAAAAKLLRATPGCTVIGIGPVTSLAQVVERMGDDIASHRFVGMHGSVCLSVMKRERDEVLKRGHALDPITYV